MKTATQLLTLSVFAVLSAVGYAAQAQAAHDHLHDASHAAAEIASHARHVQFEIRSTPLAWADRSDLTRDTAQLELSARRLQAYLAIGDLRRAEIELNSTRDLARHLSQHARATNLGSSYGFRAELSEIFQGLNEVQGEIEAEWSHYRPAVTPYSYSTARRPRVAFSFSP
jgi:hypothetical protein